MRRSFLLLFLLAAGCDRQVAMREQTDAVENARAVQEQTPVHPPAVLANATLATTNATENAVDPPGPGEPGGLPDDRTPLSEAPFGATSAQGAANVVQTYYALIERGRYSEAWKLWSDSGRASGMDAKAFAASFGKYRDYHANVGAPGRVEGAAGSLYVEVPVQVYGRLAAGEPFNLRGPVILRRSNDVPGATAKQRKWHLYRAELKQTPAKA